MTFLTCGGSIANVNVYQLNVVDSLGAGGKKGAI